MAASSQVRRVAVIGAGSGGLCAAKNLLAGGLEVSVFELGSRVGGLWVYDNDSGRSCAYRSLHTNTEADATSFRDFPFRKDTPLYPSHTVVASYLEAYAAHFDLHRHIRFQTEVVSVAPGAGHAAGRWTVGVRDGCGEPFDAVVVAPGHQAKPAHPPFSSEFAGRYVHSHAYREPEPFRGQRVLIVGVGNSALDIACDICALTASTTIASRSPVLIMPRMVWGLPVAQILGKVEKPWLPWPIARRIRELLTRMAHGRMEDWGFQTPKARTHPASHPAIGGHFTWDRIRGKPGVQSVAGHEVRFADGTTGTYDAMIAATGYEVDLPFLAAELSPVVDRRVQLYRRIVAPDWPGLYFIGYFNLTGGGNIRMMDNQCRWMTAVITGELELPDRAQMRAAIEAERRQMARRYPSRPRYGLELEPREYGRLIREDLARVRPTTPADPSPPRAAPAGPVSAEPAPAKGEPPSVARRVR